MTEGQPDERVGGKGRPTPKRREAERRRRQPVAAPQTRREAARQVRQRSRAAQTQARAALRTGDERNLPPRDAGPVRRYVRDLVDARHNAGNYVLLVALVVVVVGFIPAPAVRLAVAICYPLVLLWVIVDAFLLVRLIRRRVTTAFPGERTRGLGSYAVMRSFQVRRLRLPPPKVKLGQSV